MRFEGCVETKYTDLFDSVHIPAALLLEIAPVRHSIRCFDMCDVTALCNIGSVLVRGTNFLDAIDETLHHLQFWDVEMVYLAVLAPTPAFVDNRVLLDVKFQKRLWY